MVSGEVLAEENRGDFDLKKYGIPTDLEVAEATQVVPAGMLLMGGKGTEAKPVEAPGKLLKIRIRQPAKIHTIPVLDGAREMKILTVDDAPFAGGYHFVDKKNNALAKRKITLFDKDNKAVATCLQMKPVNIIGQQDFVIFGQNPFYEGQPTESVEGLDAPAYKWFDLKGMYTNKYYETVAHKDGRFFGGLCMKGTPVSAMTGIQKGVIFTSTHKGKEQVVARLYHKQYIMTGTSSENDKDTTGWDIGIAHGIDPLPIACIAAVLEHLERQVM